MLTETETGGAAAYVDMWVPSNHPLVYVYHADNSLHLESIRLKWLAEDREWKYYFKPQTAYRIKVRSKKPEVKSNFKNLFMLVEVLEEDVQFVFSQILSAYFN